MKARFCLRTILFLVAIQACVLRSSGGTDVPQRITYEQLKEYSKEQDPVAPAAKSDADIVKACYPGRDSYTLAEINEALQPAKSAEYWVPTPNHTQVGPVPKGCRSADRSNALLKHYAAYHRVTADLNWALRYFFGDQDWYRLTQIAYVEQHGSDAPARDQTTTEAQQKAAAAKKAQQAGEASRNAKLQAGIDSAKYYADHPWEHFLTGFKMPLVRASWRDVLSDEDPSERNDPNFPPPPSTPKDIVGAKLSYAHDAMMNSNTWTAVGALILPWQMELPGKGIIPDKLSVAPSVSIDRVDSNAMSQSNIDDVLYRVGLYALYNFDKIQPYTTLEIRAAGVYASDTGGHGRLPGYEVDLEPRFMDPILPLGYKKVLVKNPEFDNKIPQPPPNAASPAPQVNPALCDVSLRAWLHLEGGDVQDNGTTWGTTKGEFFRMGPTVQFQLEFPQFKLVGGHDFSISAYYAYLPAITGSDAHDSYVKVSAVLDLYKDVLKNRSISLTADYQYGGLSFTKEDVNLFTVGLGVKF